MNHAEYVFSDEHQNNLKELRTKCGGLVNLADYIRGWATDADLDSLLVFLPYFIGVGEDALALTQKMKQNLREAQEASE
jgi:hypothetical protein